MSFKHKLYQSILKPVVDTFFPPVCFLCENILNNNREVVCLKCWSAMPRLTNQKLKDVILKISPKYFDNVFILYDFSDTFQNIIHLLKYKQCLKISNYFADELRNNYSTSFFSNYNLILAVPLHPVKLRERGYNQSFEIIKHLDFNVQKNILKRIKYTTSQTTLSREERLNNMKNAFSCSNSVSGKKILLFDDIITTGSTLNECTVELKRNGCTSVDILALAAPT